ncbi:MAG: TraR/DksA family transcriptional regulator [Acidimicrobiales bacterium]
MSANYNQLIGQAEMSLDRVDSALVRLAEGSYGSCAICGGVIPDEVLARDPTSEHCFEHD